MMKHKGLVICALVAALLALCGGAYAADAPVVGTIEITPSFLTSPGTVNVSITVANTTDADLKDPVVLYDPAAQVVTDFGTDGKAMLKAGESLTWTGTYDVNQRTLDNGAVVYFVMYTLYRDSGEAVEQSAPIRAKITQQTAESGISVKRVITPTVATEGQKITVDYHITNAGTVSLTNVTIAENADIHPKAQTIPELKSGQTADISYPVTMGKKNLTSGATITYEAEGVSGTQTYTVEDQTITYGSSDLTATLASSSKGVVKDGLVTLTLTLKNGGSVDFTDIRVSDPTLGEVFSNQTLAAGKTLKLDKEITLTATTDYVFSVTATDSTGVESTTATEALTVTAVNPEDALNLTLVATPDKTEAYGNPATVRFSVAITNDSNVDASKVVISHGNTTIYQFDTIPAGATRTMTRDTALSTSGKFQFTASAQDPLGNTMSFKSNEMQIAVYMPTPVPATPTPAPNPTPEPTFNPATVIPIRDPSIGAVPKAIQNVLLPVLILAGVMLVASCVLLIIATKRRADQKKASEAAYDHLERVKRRDYITPAETEEEKAAAEAEAEKQETEKKGGKKKDKKKPLTQEEQDAQMANRRVVGHDEDANWELPHVKYANDAAEEQAGAESLSALGQGLYDEEMTSDFTGFASGPVQDDVLYEQPYDGLEEAADGGVAFDGEVYQDAPESGDAAYNGEPEAAQDSQPAAYDSGLEEDGTDAGYADEPAYEEQVDGAYDGQPAASPFARPAAYGEPSAYDDPPTDGGDLYGEPVEPMDDAAYGDVPGDVYDDENGYDGYTEELNSQYGSPAAYETEDAQAGEEAYEAQDALYDDPGYDPLYDESLIEPGSEDDRYRSAGEEAPSGQAAPAGGRRRSRQSQHSNKGV